MVGRVYDLFADRFSRLSVDRSAPLPLPATHASILKWVAGRGGTVGNIIPQHPRLISSAGAILSFI